MKAKKTRLCETTGARCLEPCPCAHHAQMAAQGRVQTLEDHRNMWRSRAFRLLRVIESTHSTLMNEFADRQAVEHARYELSLVIDSFNKEEPNEEA